MNGTGAMSSKSRAPTAASPHANLYCASCNSQIGIFENNWSHLTSHYAYPKERGTDFGTQTGTNTQIVPHGTKDATATGCAMAQVFCKKCSALLGQCCKTAAKPEQKYLINLVFYKTSRTYLKDAQTFANVDFNYPDDADSNGEYDGSPGISQRSSAKPQDRRSSGMKPPYTPLRDSLPPAMSQMQSFQPTHPLASSIMSATPTSTRRPSSAGAADGSQDLAEHSQMIQDHSQQLKLVETRVSRSIFRLNELEEKIGALSKRRASAVKQVDDQAAELEQHALQLSEHDAQFQAVEKHERRLLVLETRLDAIKANLVEMKAMFGGHLPSGTNTLDTNNFNENTFVNGLEAMLQAFRNTQAPNSEVEALKEENRMLKERLDTITQVMSAVSKDDTLMLDDRNGHNDDEQLVEVTGKRKRLSTRADSQPRKSNSRRVPSITDSATEQEQLPTPLSDRVDLLQSQTQLQEGLPRPYPSAPNLAGPYFGATLLPPMVHTEENEHAPAYPSNSNVPENIDFSDDDDELLLGTDNKSQREDNLPNGTPTSSRASTGADRILTLQLPSTIRHAVEKLNGRMSRQADKVRNLYGGTSEQADAGNDLHSQATEKETSLPPRKPNGRRPVPPGKWAKVRQTPVNIGPDAPYATRPVFGNGRPRKSLPVQSTSSSTKGISISGRNTPASSSDDEETIDGHSEDVCAVCEKGGKLLCCDTCPKVYHHRCLVPKLSPKERIKGDWHCPACVSKQTATTTTITTESEQKSASAEDRDQTEKPEDQAVMEVPESSAVAEVIADDPQQEPGEEATVQERSAETKEENIAQRELLVRDIMRQEEQALQDAAAAEEDAEGDAIRLEAQVVTVVEV